jgi:hypothetical protein
MDEDVYALAVFNNELIAGGERNCRRHSVCLYCKWNGSSGRRSGAAWIIL